VRQAGSQSQSLGFLTFHSENNVFPRIIFITARGQTHTPSDLLSAVTITCHFLSPTEYFYSFETRCLFVLLARRLYVRILCQCQEREFSLASSPPLEAARLFFARFKFKTIRAEMFAPVCQKWSDLVVGRTSYLRPSSAFFLFRLTNYGQCQR
jgi:hypothetical protein